MKNRIFIIATTALVFAGCSDTDSVKQDIQNNTDAISFTSYTDKQTRATENSDAQNKWDFFNHHETFQVWGYKNTSETAVFDGDVVTVASDGAATPTYTYTYSPLRFWDKAASMYEYYAAAPSGTDGGWNFVDDNITAANITANAGQNKGYFTTSSTLTPANLSTSSNLVYTNSFKGSGDIDKLIAEKSTVPYANFKSKVNLLFIHILSRLNVTIKADENLVAPANNVNKQKIVMTSLVIKNLNVFGKFSEATNPVATGSNARWSDQGNPKEYTAVANTELTKDAQWVLQSLVIPQDAAYEAVALDGKAHDAIAAVLYADVNEYNAAKKTNLTAEQFAALSAAEKTKTPGASSVAAVSTSSKPYLVLTYTIQQTHDGTGVAIGTPEAPETFEVYYNLANAFALNEGNLAFNEGWQNTLNITIKPDVIEFCADVAEWSTYEERGLRVD